MLADYHIHSDFSDDSSCPMEEEVKKSIELGFDEICFTEHVDYGVKSDSDDVSNCDYDAYLDEFKRVKEIYGAKINLRFGIEFGIQTHTIEKFQKDFDNYNFDFVILSCHQVNDQEFWSYDFQEGKSQAEYNQKYYEEILKVIKEYDDYSILGHLDMIKRYDKQGDYPFEKTEPVIREILKHIIKAGKGIEVNTSSFRYKLNDLTPSRKILKLYNELGGEIITIGSDAHKAEDIGHKFDYIKNELKDLGFDKFCTFKDMEARFWNL